MYVIDEEREESEIQARYDELYAACQALKPLSPEEEANLLRAYQLAKKAHAGTRRKSGEPYIFHPLAVALIAVKEVGLGPIAAISALLHDVVEDTDITLEELRILFGDRVATIVDGVTKIDDVMVMQQTESKQAENYRKILLSMCNDAYVIFLKLCDRLHNMRTLDSMKETKQFIIASETSYLYVPLAHRLGLYTIKTELEELVMKYTNPEKYNEIAAKIAETARQGSQLHQCLVEPVKQMLQQAGCQFTVKTRVKSVYSCWKKIETKHVAFEEIYDLYAMRIILNGLPRDREKEECFKVYSLISDHFEPNPTRFRDWITHPKNNGYESLHTTVMTPIGRWVEIQIRTQRMDTIAEKGMAAHFLYKEAHPEEELDNNPVEEWLQQIRTSLEQSDKSALDLVEEFKEALYTKEIYLFTPKGRTITLPSRSTVLDFAYAIHTDLGHHCIGAKVNARVVSRGERLHTGDQVQVLTTNNTLPTQEWLSQCTTPRAKEAIKDLLRAHKKEHSQEGRRRLGSYYEKLHIKDTPQNWGQLKRFLGNPSDTDILYDLAVGIVTEHHVAQCFGKARPTPNLLFLTQYKDLFDSAGSPSGIDTARLKTERTADGSQPTPPTPFLLDKDYEHLPTAPAPCCKPVQGDQVVGIVQDGKIMVHRTNCRIAMREMANHENHIVRAKWRPGEQPSLLTGLALTAIDRKGLLQDITRLISDDMDLNMRAITLEASEGVGRGIIMLYINNLDHLSSLIDKLRGINGIEEVRRI
ncbi:MAG: bifunctional (p)ppGpp synthetase/guanosine-3',5'-bis(diphosphate) 3'-pyrophosphohydrolase [Bacteroidales bacterium]|nr:bifunctional (p)ppGpp synthetase/guanosine-3',5'-bis(diphosphate) 3'-pyrophosphohydrolase [Bacteroidales bacterium]